MGARLRRPAEEDIRQDVLLARKCIAYLVGVPGVCGAKPSFGLFI